MRQTNSRQCESFWVLLWLLLLALPMVCFGEEQVNRNKAAGFIKKKGACEFAAAPVYNGEPQLYSYKQGDVVRLSNEGMPILCVWNGVVGTGTINEKTGCVAGNFDLASGEYYGLDTMRVIGPPSVPVLMPIIEGKCNRKKILKLLSVPYETNRLSTRKIFIWRDAFNANYLQTDATKGVVGGTRTLEILVDVFGVGKELSPKASRSITMKKETVGREK